MLFNMGMDQNLFDPQVDNWQTECDEMWFLWYPTFEPQPYFFFLFKSYNHRLLRMCMSVWFQLVGRHVMSKMRTTKLDYDHEQQFNAIQAV